MKTDFRTIIKLPSSKWEISHEDALIFTGSCFSNNIGNRLIDYKFDALINPLGISYNPISIHQLLSGENIAELTTECKDGIYYHHLYHSSFNHAEQSVFEMQIEQHQARLEKQLRKGGYLIITYGTAWVYELLGSNTIVNNCHKEPSHKFNKRLLTVEEIVNSWNELADILQKNYPPSIKILFTISPVRHLKDGIRENQVSKSVLHLAVDQICNNYSHCSYFPSYEILMDDLRDYRFYKNDLLHPNELAIDYIWEQFSVHYFSNQTISTIQEIEKIKSALNHTPFHPNSSKHQTFLKKLLSSVREIQEKYSLNFTSEINQIQNMIS